MKELFIVEGVSAASTLNRSLDKTCQQVHAVQGKLINSVTASVQSVLENDICQQLINVLGCEPGDACDVQTLYFTKVLILCDPDIDGRHASALLMSFFSRYYRPIVEQEKLRLIKAPLFRVQMLGRDDQYADTDAELAKITNASHDAKVTRFKSIAQFSKAECSQILLHPATRREYVFN